MADILKEIMKSVPERAKISDAVFEGANIVLYTKSRDFFLDNNGIIRDIVNTIKKRIEVRPDPSMTMDMEQAEKEIRKKLVESGIVDVIISTPPNMFLNVTLSSTLWFLDKGKKGSERENKILFINAQDIFTPIDRAHNEWTPDQIQEIADIVRHYREEPSFAKASEGKKKYEDIKGRCKIATLEEIRENEYSLNPGRYVEIVDTGISNIDFEKRMKELTSEFTTLTDEAHKLENKIINDWKRII